MPALLALSMIALPASGTIARIGETVRVGGLRVRVERVVEDSRCPSDVACVWAGCVRVQAVVSGEAWRRRVTLTLDRPIHVADGMLTLTGVTPPRTIRAIAPREYRFTLTFSGGL